MFCPNCGAEFEETEAHCPYCGQLNPRGAEKQHMNKLHALRKNTAHLAEETQASVRHGARQNARRLAILVGILLLLVAAFFILRTVVGNYAEKRTLQNLRDRAAFREAHFEELDRLYLAGDDEALREYVYSLADEPGQDELFSWDHYNAFSDMETYFFMKEDLERLETQTPRLSDYTSIVYSAFYLTRSDHALAYNGLPYTKEEEERLEQYRTEAEAALQSLLQMNTTELDQFYENCLGEYDVLSYRRLEKNVKARLQELGIDL